MGGDALASLRDLACWRRSCSRSRGRCEGAAGWAYALTLGFALVYLGEHYVIDLIAGAALVAGGAPGRAAGEPAARTG